MSGVFDAYGRYYDLLYRDKDYAAETDYVAAHLPKGQGLRALDLGCGTGVHAEHLARRGWCVHGVDLSASMLEKAAARKASLPPDIARNLSFAEGDVRTVRTGETYDAVVSLFHVMSYQTGNDDLAAAFATAAAHLKSGGLFLFDYWYGPAVLAQKPERRTRHLQDDAIDVTRTAVPVLRPSENVVDVNYTVAITVKATGERLAINETHSMRYLFLPEIEGLAAGQDWGHCAHAAWMKTEAPGERDWAAFTVLERQ